MFYVFHGDDEHSQKETLTDLQRKMGDPAMLDLNTARFEGQGLTFSQLRHACDSIPFLSDKRLVIVNNLFSNATNQSLLEEVLAYLPHLPETTRLVFLESKSLGEKHSLLKLAQGEKGFVKAFTRPEGSNLERWIRQRVEKLGGRIAPRATHTLAENVSNDLRALDNEIEKLVLYKEPGETIQEEDVFLLCPYVAEANVFDLVDALGARQGRTAVQLLQKKYNEGVDPFYLFSMFVRQFRLLIQVKELADASFDAQAISKSLKIHAFVAGKLLQQSKGYQIAQLEGIYAHLLEMDLGVKTGRMDMATALDLLVAGLAH
jgi:DNA polymerase-3 subunit delta